jgi:hypothetical protein
MAKHSISRRHRRSNRRSRGVKRGGSGNYTSAATYGSYVNGSVPEQYARVFDQGGAYGNAQSNISIGAQGQNATFAGAPTQSNLQLIQRTGKKSRKNRRGGLVGEVISQAVVPFSILALQQTYRKKRGGKSKKNRRR